MFKSVAEMIDANAYTYFALCDKRHQGRWGYGQSPRQSFGMLFSNPLFHVYAGQLNKTLRKFRNKGNGFNEVDLGSVYVASQESGDVLRKIRLVDQAAAVPEPAGHAEQC
jgi:hypothetical protein